MTSTANRLSYNLAQKGQLNAAGITAASKKSTEELLLKDAEKHHCYFRSAGLHNHLTVGTPGSKFATYDLGATASHLKKIYDVEAAIQRPILVEEKDASISVNDDNWVQYLGNQSAYGSFFKFFSGKVADLGAGPTLEKFVFDAAANASGKVMLIRVMSGAQQKYGLEFGDETLVATGLAQAAVHTPTAPEIYDFSYEETSSSDPGLTVLEILRQVYDSEVLKPAPYEPNALFTARLRKIVERGHVEMRKICAGFHVDTRASDAVFASKVEQFIWASTLLMSATGRKGREVRLDFFLMHLVTSSLFLQPFLRVLENPISKANLLRAAPGASPLRPTKSAIGLATDDADYNPWPVMFEDVVYHPDAHVLKAFRALAFGAREYGAVPAGEAIGAFLSETDSKESHPGAAQMDGTIFVRAAGMMMDYMGWTAHGQEARDDWDRSALGWDAAWDKDVDISSKN
ncbi:hypothetical protein FA13DRAFT_1748166 [Coprinellus micaceus]|uniref:Oxidoreductase AflY n=1 Tax=Coprinellus micaceus TaxID=71717 RepID=A0A4Y7RYG3_COPMI|nr:hypothetical protein FA13DRAFT_1748166 [Coprinellus micaceus]